MRASDISNLLYNPVWISNILHYFISGACSSNSKKVKYELIYFALPFIYDEIISEKLSNSSKKSTLATFLSPIEVRNQLLNCPKKIEEFRIFTNQGLVYLGNKYKLTINNYIHIDQILSYSQEKKPIEKYYYKAAYNLGYIFANEDYKNIFLKFGVMNL